MKRIFACVYVLVLLTQLPHVHAAYAGLERPGWYQWTAWGAAGAFELSILVFTYRIVVERSTRRSTRLGLGFFLVASATANASYYGLAPAVMRTLMPMFATVALPISLALFASEFGAEVRRDERRAQRAAAAATAQAAEPAPLAVAEPTYACRVCGQEFRSQNALNAHSRQHVRVAAAGMPQERAGGNGNGKF